MKNTTRVLNLSIEDITPYDFGEYTNAGYKWVDFGKNNDYPSFLRNLSGVTGLNLTGTTAKQTSYATGNNSVVSGGVVQLVTTSINNANYLMGSLKTKSS